MAKDAVEGSQSPPLSPSIATNYGDAGLGGEPHRLLKKAGIS